MLAPPGCYLRYAWPSEGGHGRKLGMQEPTSQEIYRGKLVTLRIQTVPQPIGGTSSFEIVEHPDAVAVVALRPDPDGKPDPLVALVRQPRPAIGRDTWEIPAGLMKPEDARDPQLTATRELREETGYSAGVWLKLSREYPSPGFSTEAITIYLASGLERAANVPIAAADAAYQEISEVRWMPLREAVVLCRRGEIDDGKTVLGLYLARDALGKKSQEARSTGGEAMAFDPTNPPNLLPTPPDIQAMAKEEGNGGTALNIENMLLAEFNYASSTAYQAMEDRARTFNLYLLIFGVLASGLGALYQLGNKLGGATNLFALALLFASGIMGILFFLQLIRLREAHRNSTIAMNVIKEYYIGHFKEKLPDIDDAFRWRFKTMPTGEKFRNVAFMICATVAMLGSLCFAAAAFVLAEISLGQTPVDLLTLPASTLPYVIFGAVLVVSFGLHIVYYRRTLSSKRDRKTLTAAAQEQHISYTETHSRGRRK